MSVTVLIIDFKQQRNEGEYYDKTKSSAGGDPAVPGRPL